MMKSLNLSLIATALLLCCASPARAGEPADLLAAVRAADLDRVEALLAASPQLVQARTEQTQTPLHLAAQAGHLALMDRLLAAGAAVNAVDHQGHTPLHIAAARFREQAARRLLAAGADVNAVNAAGMTPLCLAASTGPGAPEVDALLTALAEVLLAHGAEVNAEDHHGLTPLDHALARGHTNLAELLRRHGALQSAVRIAPPPTRDEWTPYSQIGPTLLQAETDYPDICKRYDLGLSYQGRSLWALRISDNVLVEEDEPEFKYISTMHGDEVIGTEMCLLLIDHLLTNYGTDPQATNLVDEVEMWIVPLMNPDGYDRSPRTRYNLQGIDLNRNFPEGAPPSPDPNTPTGRATETQVIMNWCFGQSFTCSANFHTGALVVNYPFDNDGSASRYTPDQDLFVYISEEYSQYNLPMWNSPIFTHGITNGADWYEITGGMQDWNYRYMGCNEVTIELSNTKEPPPSQIPTFWDDNRDSMLAYMDTCLIGVRGLVSDATTGLPVAATVTVVGRDHEIYTDPDVGDYHRMLLPGTYDLQFEADGYNMVEIAGVVVNAGDATRLDVVMGLPSPPTAYPADLSTIFSTPLTITLQAVDDGRPDPPGALTYLITTLPDQTLRDAGNGHIITGAELPYALVGGGNQVAYDPGLCFVGLDSFEFKANDGDVPPDGGDSNTALVTIEVILAPWLQHSFPMDTDPGWSTEGQWAFGQPTGGGTHDGDPTSGHTGDNVYGYNLDGDYSTGMPQYFLTAGPIDCTSLTAVELRFWRWLGAESAPFDHAIIQVSDNGTAWTTAWTNTDGDVSDDSWTQVTLPISAVADNQPTVYLRWGMGPTDGSVTYPGWNLDDVEIWALGPVCEDLPGDFDDDGDVDLSDFATFARCYAGAGVTNPPPGCSPEEFDLTDLDDDSDVDLSDFATFANNYTG